MKIYVIGVGGVGGYFGGILAKAGNDVTFVSRGSFYNAMIDKGLKVNCTDDDFIIKPVKVINSISKITDPDLIILCVKTYDNEQIAKDLIKVVSNKTVVITFQNGIENDIFIKNIIKKCTVIPGAAFVISSKGKDGEINQTGGLKRLIFGSRDRNNKKIKIIYNMFIKSGIDTILSEDIETDLWKKYIYIIPFCGFTAMFRLCIGQIREDKCLYVLYKKAIEEVIDVAIAKNINLPDDIYEKTIILNENTAYNSKSSFLIDIEKGNKTEIETLNGSLVKIAKEMNVYIPINEIIYLAIKYNSKLTNL